MDTTSSQSTAGNAGQASGFKYPLGAAVKITASGEAGTVRGRAEYLNSENNYYLHYVNARGVACSDWVAESLLT